MSERIMVWISVVCGAAVGATLGFHDARPAPVPSATHRKVAAPQNITVHVTRRATTASLIETQPTLPVIASQADVPLPSPEANAVQPAPEARRVVAPRDVVRAAQPKAKLTPARVVPPPSTARFPDSARNEELRDPRAVFRAESACARRDPEQCLRAARAFRVGVATKPNPRSASIYWHSAQKIYEERCKRREPLSCVGLAAMYEKGPGTQPTYAPDLVEHARGICTHRYQTDCDALDTEKERLRTLLEGLDTPTGDVAP